MQGDQAIEGFEHALLWHCSRVSPVLHPWASLEVHVVHNYAAPIDRVTVCCVRALGPVSVCERVRVRMCGSKPEHVSPHHNTQRHAQTEKERRS